MTAKLQVRKRETGARANPELKAIVSAEDKVRLNVDMPKSRRQALKARAVAEDRTINDIVNELVAEYLAQ
jgi:hypothetical protein